jgi:acetoin utilization deacetylase AcuC-like enzyme
MEKFGLAVPVNDTEHEAPPGHPENAARLSSALRTLNQPEMQEWFVPLPTSTCHPQILERVHDETYLGLLKRLEEQGGGQVDPDTYLTETSFSAALNMAGTVVAAVERAFDDGPGISLVLGRPPGHHASSDRGMGFCLINNVAVAAQYALDRGYASRVAIVDFDVHHGNGTQDIFYERGEVLYISSHQYPFYPGTGAADEIGRGEGEGATLNLPLSAGSGNDEFLRRFHSEADERLKRFAPRLLLVSAGFDGHRLDPLGGLALTGRAFAALGRMLRGIAAASASDRMVTVLEGGYSQEGNLDSIVSYIKGLRA